MQNGPTKDPAHYSLTTRLSIPSCLAPSRVVYVALHGGHRPSAEKKHLRVWELGKDGFCAVWPCLQQHQQHVAVIHPVVVAAACCLCRSLAPKIAQET